LRGDGNRGISSATVDSNDDLVLTLVDSTTVNAGSVVGPAGPTGAAGPTGPQGPSGTNIEFDVVPSGSTAFNFDGAGFSSATSNPTLYLQRGQTYNFDFGSSTVTMGWNHASSNYVTASDAIDGHTMPAASRTDSQYEGGSNNVTVFTASNGTVTDSVKLYSNTNYLLSNNYYRKSWSYSDSFSVLSGQILDYTVTSYHENTASKDARWQVWFLDTVSGTYYQGWTNFGVGNSEGVSFGSNSGGTNKSYQFTTTSTYRMVVVLGVEENFAQDIPTNSGNYQPVEAWVQFQNFGFNNGHPFWLQSTSGAYDAANVLGSSDGVTNNGATRDILIYEVPMNAPDTLYYVCENHSAMAGTIYTSTPAYQAANYTTTNRNALTAQNGDLIYNSTTHKFQGYANGSWVDLH